VRNGFPRVAIPLILVSLALAVAVFAWVWAHRPAPPADPRLTSDPRLTADTPFRNVRPDVRYVGDAACVKCHSTQAETYRHHPMARSLTPVASVAAGQRYGDAVRNPFEADGFQYLVEHRDERVFHRETCRDAQGRVLAENRAEIDFAIGSGTRAHSYLVNRDGYLFESPITWYAQKSVWDLSPGYAGRRTGFERGVRPECLFCHCNQAEPVADTVNRYRREIFQGHGIGCERCHGPGELHAALRQHDKTGGFDSTIVNPAHLDAPLRESVCEQCHLQGAARVVRRGLDVFAFRPGLPLRLFWSVFVRPPEFADHLLVGQVEQMHESRCYRESREQNKLGCVSCHNPHASPPSDGKAVFYRDRCLTCHEKKGCTEPLARRLETVKDDSCIACHMPRLDTVDIEHTAVTDHRVIRRTARPAPAVAPRRLQPGEVPLTHFHRDQLAPDDPEVARDLGLALVDLAREKSLVRKQLAESAERLLDAAVERRPDDVIAWEGRARALWAQDRPGDALVSCERALALAPTREQSLIDAANYADALNNRDAAIGYCQRARAVNPWATEPRFRLARLWSEAKEWDKAFEEARAVLQDFPTNIEMHLVLVSYYLDKGDKERAQTEFDAALALHPRDPDALRRWYAGQKR
jgi:Tfp pilus assembly protein PilF